MDVSTLSDPNDNISRFRPLYFIWALVGLDPPGLSFLIENIFVIPNQCDDIQFWWV